MTFTEAQKAAVLALGELQSCYVAQFVKQAEVAAGQTITDEQVAQCAHLFAGSRQVGEAISMVMALKEPA